MSHLSPFVVVAGRSVQGVSLGFHAYSLRIDNLSNQWLQEESSLAWFPPYSLGTIIRLYGTAVAMLYNVAPQGQVQLPPVQGEYAIAVYADEYRTETSPTGIPKEAKAAYYERERNPIPQSGAFYNFTGIGPHAYTQRFLYTVPANRAFMLTYAVAEGFRNVDCLSYNTNSPAIANVSLPGVADICNAYVRHNTVTNLVDRSIYTGQQIVSAGQQVGGFTQDPTYGGTIVWRIAFMGTEFDV